MCVNTTARDAGLVGTRTTSIRPSGAAFSGKVRDERGTLAHPEINHFGIGPRPYNRSFLTDSRSVYIIMSLR